MGRRKIEIQPITHERNRSVTFLKRKNGLFKKAYELGVLCSVDVAVVIFGQNHKLYEYCSGDGDNIARRRVDFSGDRDLKGPADFGGEKADAMDEDDEEQSDDPSPPSKRPRTTSGNRTATSPAKIKAKTSGHVTVAPKKSDTKLSESPPTPPPAAAHPSLPPPIPHLQLNLSSSRGGPYPRDPSNPNGGADSRNSPPGAAPLPHISYYHPNYAASHSYHSSHDRRGSIPSAGGGSGRYDPFGAHPAAAAWKLAQGNGHFRPPGTHEDHYHASSGDGSRSASPDDGSVVTSAGPTARVHSIYASHPFDLISTGGKPTQLPAATELDWPATAGATQSFHRSPTHLPPPPASAPAASSEGSWLDFLSTPTPLSSSHHHSLAHHPPPFATTAANHFTAPAIAASNQPHAQLQAWERQWRAAAGGGAPNGAAAAVAPDMFPFDVAAAVQDLVRSTAAAATTQALSLPTLQQRQRLGSDPSRPNSAASSTVQQRRRLSQENKISSHSPPASLNGVQSNRAKTKIRLGSLAASTHAESEEADEAGGVDTNGVDGLSERRDGSVEHRRSTPPTTISATSHDPMALDMDVDIEAIALATALASVGAGGDRGLAVNGGGGAGQQRRHSSLESAGSVSVILGDGAKDEEVEMVLGL